MPETVLIPEVGDIVAGKYRIEKLLGSGGMGTVFAARHTTTRRLFALKLLSESLSEDDEAKVRFVREAKLAGKIDHPAVVRIYDIGYHGAALYMVMDLLVGESLNDRLKRGPFPVTDAIRVMLGILDGVSAAHKKGIVHRDLKPENIFLCRAAEQAFPDPRILDFGVSKALAGGDASVLALTRTGQMLGTPLYMSPEQVQGFKDIDQRADIYALGVILYQMLSGEIPFKAESFPGLIFEIISGAAKPFSQAPSGISAELNDVVMTAMALSPNDRFASVERFAQAIRPFAQGNAEQSVACTNPPDLRRSSIPDTPTPFKTEIEKTIRTPLRLNRRSSIAIAASLVVALIVVGVAAFYAFGSGKSAAPSSVTQTARPPQSPKATQVVSQPRPSSAPKGASQLQSRTKASETKNPLPLGMTAPKDDSEYLGRIDKEKRSNPPIDKSKKPERKAKSEPIYPHEYVPVEKKPELKPLTKSSDFEIDDDEIIDPFEE